MGAYHTIILLWSYIFCLAVTSKVHIKFTIGFLVGYAWCQESSYLGVSQKLDEVRYIPVGVGRTIGTEALERANGEGGAVVDQVPDRFERFTTEAACRLFF